MEVEIKFKPEQVIGYLDVIHPKDKRTETIDAKEDCFLLYISKAMFLESTLFAER